MPKICHSEREAVIMEMDVLKEILSPAGYKGSELAGAVLSMFSVFPWGTRHDEAHNERKTDMWCSELEYFPLYAVKLAVKWAVKQKKEPSLGEFIKRVRLEIGDNVLERKRLLESLI